MHHKRLDSVAITWAGVDMLDSGSVALSLALEEGDLTLHDAGDENGFLFGPPPPDWPRYPLT